MNLALKIFIAISLIGVIVMSIGWKLTKNKKTMQEEIELSRTRNSFVPVKIAVAKRESFSESFTVYGTFQPSKEVTLISDVNGKVTELDFYNGKYVKAGSVLFTVDNELISNELELTQLNLHKAERDVQRMKNLLKKGGVTEVQFEEAKLGAENLKVKIKSLQKRLNDTHVKAPITGTISQKRVELGSYIAPGSPVTNIVNINKIFLHAFLTESQVITIKKGQTVEVTGNVYPSKEIIGRIKNIDVKADDTKRFLVEIALDNPSGNLLKAGMNGKVHFKIDEKLNALLIPREVFIGSLQDGQLFVVADNKVVLRKVEPGKTFENMVEIVAGLTEGENVVLTGQINLTDGTEVRVLK